MPRCPETTHNTPDAFNRFGTVSREVVLFGNWRTHLGILAREIMQDQSGVPILDVIEGPVLALAEHPVALTG